ncbi:COG1361 S-layer family protein [Cellulosilyticum sp. I15G10I2]|uniref:COG1361 S-layer family protein n=1 Tax=Cellulosilyticum sp. I15G10I2 TaxID=1892843 RepID=UPI00085C2622|nr:hypothetical protein [Cellulosilyticum sp. I15G10I2]
MRNKNRMISMLLSLVMILTSLIPGTIKVYGTGISTEYIVSITQGTSYLYPDDNFTLTVNVQLGEMNIDKDGNFPSEDAVSVGGSAIDASKMNYSVEYLNADSQENPSKIIISGLKYTGRGKDATVRVVIADTNEVTQVISKDITLSAMTLSETQDMLKVDDVANVLVKAGATQNAQVKVINQGKQTLRNVKVQLELAEKVEGIKIKTEEAIISQLQAKEVKTAAFSVEVDAEVKAKVYKANAIVNGASFPVNLQVDSHIVPSVLEVSTDSSKIFNPGVAQDATISIKNVGERPARNIRVEINSENVAIVGGSNVKHIPVINAKGSSDITMRLRVDAKVKDNSVPIKVDMTYLNSLGEEAKDTQYIYLSTTASAISSEVVIGNIVSPLGTYGVDENFMVKFNISSKGPAENLKISVQGGEGIVPKSQNLFFVPKLSVGEKKEYAVTLAATRTAVSSTHPIQITVEYGDTSKPITISQYSSVNVVNPDKDEEGSETKKGTPKVIIGHYKSEPVVVRAGEQFDLEIGFLNAHKTQSVHNLKANLAVREEGEKNTGSVFTPVGASNTFYIADLAPGQTEIKRIRLYTIPSASPKTYEISIEMEYEDNKGNEVKATENIGIPVEQVTKIEIGDIQVDYAQVGMPTYFNATIYNTGKTDISNMMISIEGEGFSVEDNKMFVGVFEKGATENYAPTIIANMSGNLTGNMIIQYEEATGEVREVTKEFTIEVAEMAMPPDMPIDDPGMMPQPNGPKLPLLLGGGLGILIAGIVSAVILKKRKAKKEKMMLDEDE